MILLVACLAAGCAEPEEVPGAPSLPDGVAMRIDGVDVPRAMLDDYDAYLRDLDPRMGRNHTTRILLDELVIPVLFARREFAKEWEEQRAHAGGLRRALGEAAGYDDFVQRTKTFRDAEKLPGVIRQHLPLPEQRWLFADENLGRVSPVLEHAQGFSVVAATDKDPGLTKAFDRADAFVVRFYTQRAQAYRSWWVALQKRLGELPPSAILVHPDFRDAIPPWLPEFRIATPRTKDR